MQVSPSIRLLLVVTAVYAIGFVGYLGLSRGIPFWYDGLVKPPSAPKAWLFEPLSVVLHGLVAISAWLAVKLEESKQRTIGLVLVWAGLLLFALWNWTFFAIDQLGPSIAVASLAAGCILGAGITIGFKSRIAGALLLPLFLWICYAADLDRQIWQTNRDQRSPAIGVEISNSSFGPNG